jgi:hypothetical protein
MDKTVRIQQTVYRLIFARFPRSGPGAAISSPLALIVSLTPIILIISRNMILTMSSIWLQAASHQSFLNHLV